MSFKNKILDAIVGLVVGDAVGVPYEFISRDKMQKRPATDMIAFGTHNQNIGTWSDDSSLTLCLLDSLTHNKYSLEKIARKLVSWKYEKEWTANGEIFDIGNTTAQSLALLKTIFESGKLTDLEQLKFTGTEFDNGNGSLMRILPLAFYLYQKPLQEQWQKTWEVSALTHPPFRSAMACFIYIKIIEKILQGENILEAYIKVCFEITSFWQTQEFSKEEFVIFERILSGNIKDYKVTDIRAGGYVIDTLEAALWVLLNTNSYKNAILKAVNLGDDTDTTAAVAGGIAGLFYGINTIPLKWYKSIVRCNEIKVLCKKFSTVNF